METYQFEAQKMASDLLQIAGVDFDRSSLLTQALIGTFLFGMLHAHSMLARLRPEEAYSLAFWVFQDVLHYTPEAAAEGIQHCIEATRPGYHDTMNAILHRGIDGHRQYIEMDTDGLRRNITSVLEHFHGDGLR